MFYLQISSQIYWFLPRYTFVSFRVKIGDDEETTTRRVPSYATSGAATSTCMVRRVTVLTTSTGADAKDIRQDIVVTRQ